MAKHFNQNDIEEFSDCVGLFAKDAKHKCITSQEELTIIMRSLGFSPTVEEIQNYYESNKSEPGRLDFATFLDIMYTHSQKERCQQEIMLAFQAHDRNNTGTIPSAELHHILCNFGEKLSRQEVDRLFQEARIPRGEVPYGNIVQTLLTPMPDY